MRVFCFNVYYRFSRSESVQETPMIADLFVRILLDLRTSRYVSWWHRNLAGDGFFNSCTCWVIFFPVMLQINSSPQKNRWIVWWECLRIISGLDQGTRLVDAKHVEGREARDVLLGKTAAKFGGKTKTSLNPCKMRSEIHASPAKKWNLKSDGWKMKHSFGIFCIQGTRRTREFFWGCISTCFRCYSDMMSTCHFVALVPKSSRSARIFTQWSPLRNGSWLFCLMVSCSNQIIWFNPFPLADPWDRSVWPPFFLPK